MRDIKLDGISKINGGEYRIVSVDGITQINSSLKVRSFFIDGKCKVNGDTFSDELFCDGITEIKGNLTAVDIKVDGMLTVDGKNVESITLVCDGNIKVKGSIFSEIVDANGVISANRIIGNKVNIKSLSGKFMKLFFSPVSKINIIKAEQIELSGVKSQSIIGNNIIIGPFCEINTINCSGKLKIDKRSNVNNILGKYSLLY